MNARTISAGLLLLGGVSACGGGGGSGDGGGSGQGPDLGSGPPVAQAGPDQTVFDNTIAQLDGRRSFDTGGGGALQYEWVYRTGPTRPTLSNPNSPTPTFLAERTPSLSVYLYELTVRDNEGFQSTDQVRVIVEPTPPEQTLLGTISFDRVPSSTQTSGLDYTRTDALPAPNVVVELLSDSGEVVDVTETSAGGVFRFAVGANQQRRVRVRARSVRASPGFAQWDVRVVDNTSGGAMYVLDGAVLSTGTSNSVRNLHAGSGWTGAAYTETRSAAPFAILASIHEAMSDFVAVDDDIVFPPLTVNWSPRNSTASGDLSSGDIGTSFYQRIGNQSNIFLLGAADSDTDEYDDHIVIHEWGHYFEDRLSRSDSIGGQHGTGDHLDMRVAFGEGFGNALSGMITNDPFYRDSFGAGQRQGFAIDVESGIDPSVGWYSEGSVQQFLYDLYDATNDAADNDAVRLGLQPIYEVLVSPSYRQMDVFTGVHAFARELRDRNGFRGNEIDALLDHQNIVSGAQLDRFGEGEANNAGRANVLPIYSDLTVGGGPTQVCSIDDFGDYNKLSNWRFLRFVVGAAGSHTVTVRGDRDPDFVLVRNGVELYSFAQNSGAVGIETVTLNLEAGVHVMAATEFSNADQQPGNGRDVCLDVTVQAN